MILFFDALVVIPFAWYRNQQMPIKYSAIKIFNVVINLLLNVFFFLVLPQIVVEDAQSIFEYALFDNKVHYIFIANLMASVVTFIVVLPLYFRIGFGFDRVLWKKMFLYAFPVLVAGIAFSINEGFDRIILRSLLPAETADASVGVYAACYKLGVFMTLFITAFKLGVEPFSLVMLIRKTQKTLTPILPSILLFSVRLFCFL